MLKKILNRLYYYFASPEKYAKFIGVKVGNGCYISTKHFATEPYLITIGNNVRIAPGTSFYTYGGTWCIRKKYNNPTLDTFGKISIGNNSYIGENCMIMSGVTIGENCLIGGGSVVSRSVPDGVMVAGNPAKFIGYTDQFYQKVKANSALCCKGRKGSKKQYLLSLEDDVFVRKPNIKIPDK